MKHHGGAGRCRNSSIFGLSLLIGFCSNFCFVASFVNVVKQHQLHPCHPPNHDQQHWLSFTTSHRHDVTRRHQQQHQQQWLRQPSLLKMGNPGLHDVVSYETITTLYCRKSTISSSTSSPFILATTARRRRRTMRQFSSSSVRMSNYDLTEPIRDDDDEGVDEDEREMESSNLVLDGNDFDDEEDDDDDDDDGIAESSSPFSSSLSSISFEDLGLCSEALSAIRAQPDWNIPTPIQQMAIPRLLLMTSPKSVTTKLHDSNDDDTDNDDAATTATTTATPLFDSVWCEAPTGSGKTAAYALPLLHNLLLQQSSSSQQNSIKRRRGGGVVQALILCPTRELAMQIGNVLSNLASNMSTKRRKRPLQQRQRQMIDKANEGRTTTIKDKKYKKQIYNKHINNNNNNDNNNENINNSNWNIQVIHGGVPLEPQIASLASCIHDGWPIDVLVATPGRLADIMTFYDNNDSDDNDNMKEPPSKVSAAQAALEKRLLNALDEESTSGARGGRSGRRNKNTADADATLSLSKIQALQLDRRDSSTDDTDGRGLLRNLLSNVKYVVLDEADRLLGRAFEQEMDALLHHISSSQQQQHKQQHQSSVQSWLFSATFPKHMEPRIDFVLKQMSLPSSSGSFKPPLRISCAQSDRVLYEEVSSQLQKKLDRLSTNKNTTAGDNASTSLQQQQRLEQVGPASTIHLRTIRLDKRDRTQALRRLLENPQQPQQDQAMEQWDRVLVFVATRYSSEHVATKLRRVGIASAELHGKLDQEARDRRLSDFKKGKIRVLLATDVASRGLDVVGLPVVINYDLPRSTTDFTHRIGRTGRAGRRGVAITFVTPESEAQLDLIEKRHLSQPVEREILPGLEPNEDEWLIRSQAAKMDTPGVQHSNLGLAHDRMFGGIKGRRKSKKDRLREQIVRKEQSTLNEDLTQ